MLCHTKYNTGVQIVDNVLRSGAFPNPETKKIENSSEICFARFNLTFLAHCRNCFRTPEDFRLGKVEKMKILPGSPV